MIGNMKRLVWENKGILLPLCSVTGALDAGTQIAQFEGGQNLYFSSSSFL